VDLTWWKVKTIIWKKETGSSQQSICLIEVIAAAQAAGIVRMDL
jgi:hypothetical protein